MTALEECCHTCVDCGQVVCADDDRNVVEDRRCGDCRSDQKAENDYACEHGLQVGMPDPHDPLECQVCDWCPRCEGVRRWDEHARCVACRRAWGADEDCHDDPCRCGG